jgi:hypothetical protein
MRFNLGFNAPVDPSGSSFELRAILVQHPKYAAPRNSMDVRDVPKTV